MLSGTGFYWQRPLLAFIPALVIIPLAFGAAFTQWCFASAWYRLIVGGKADCCRLRRVHVLGGWVGLG